MEAYIDATVQWPVCKEYPDTAAHAIPAALAIEPTRGIEVSMSDRENGDVPLAMAVIERCERCAGVGAGARLAVDERMRGLKEPQ